MKILSIGNMPSIFNMDTILWIPSHYLRDWPGLMISDISRYVWTHQPYGFQKYTCGLASADVASDISSG